MTFQTLKLLMLVFSSNSILTSVLLSFLSGNSVSSTLPVLEIVFPDLKKNARPFGPSYSMICSYTIAEVDKIRNTPE